MKAKLLIILSLLGLVLVGCTGKGVKSISINSLGLGDEIFVGQTKDLTISTEPSGLEVEVEWSSSSSDVVEVSSTGSVTGLKLGHSTITAVSKSNSNIKGTIVVTVVNERLDITSLSIEGPITAPLKKYSIYHVTSVPASSNKVVWNVVASTGSASFYVDDNNDLVLAPLSLGKVFVEASSVYNDSISASKIVTITETNLNELSLEGDSFVSVGSVNQYSISNIDNYFEKPVTWSIVSGSDKGSIDSAGILTVNNSIGTIVIKAIIDFSFTDEDLVYEKTINIVTDNTTLLNALGIGNNFTLKTTDNSFAIQSTDKVLYNSLNPVSKTVDSKVGWVKGKTDWFQIGYSQYVYDELIAKGVGPTNSDILVFATTPITKTHEEYADYINLTYGINSNFTKDGETYTITGGSFLNLLKAYSGIDYDKLVIVLNGNSIDTIKAYIGVSSTEYVLSSIGSTTISNTEPLSSINSEYVNEDQIIIKQNKLENLLKFLDYGVGFVNNDLPKFTDTVLYSLSSSPTLYQAGGMNVYSKKTLGVWGSSIDASTIFPANSNTHDIEDYRLIKSDSETYYGVIDTDTPGLQLYKFNIHSRMQQTLPEQAHNLESGLNIPDLVYPNSNWGVFFINEPDDTPNTYIVRFYVSTNITLADTLWEEYKEVLVNNSWVGTFTIDGYLYANDSLGFQANIGTYVNEDGISKYIDVTFCPYRKKAYSWPTDELADPVTGYGENASKIVNPLNSFSNAAFAFIKPTIVVVFQENERDSYVTYQRTYLNRLFNDFSWKYLATINGIVIVDPTETLTLRFEEYLNNNTGGITIEEFDSSTILDPDWSSIDLTGYEGYEEVDFPVYKRSDSPEEVIGYTITVVNNELQIEFYSDGYSNLTRRTEVLGIYKSDLTGDGWTLVDRVPNPNHPSAYYENVYTKGEYAVKIIDSSLPYYEYGIITFHLFKLAN